MKAIEGMPATPLKVTIIGAGIGGITAALALRRAGHNVQVFEKSKFASETGAALGITPNGAKVLRILGFDFKRARARDMVVWEVMSGLTLERISGLDISDAEERYGEISRTIHRVDLHNELLHLATQPGENPVLLHLSSEVTKVDPVNGSIELADGATYSADIVVAADGLHSVARNSVISSPPEAYKTNMSAFRFLLPTEVMKADPTTAKLLETKGLGSSIFVDTSDAVNERHIVWYDCRDGEVQNFVGVHPTRQTVDETERQSMYEEYKHFKPELLRIIELADDIKCWPLISHKPLPKWVHGRSVLIGDAAHPMLPFGGQGSNQAIEDGGALGQLLLGACPESVAERLRIFERLRYNRTSIIQILSNVRIGREMEVQGELERYASSAEKVPSSFPERVVHHFDYDVLDACQGLVSND